MIGNTSEEAVGRDIFLKLFAAQSFHLENGFIILTSQTCSGIGYMSLNYPAHSLALPSIPSFTSLTLATSTTDLGYCKFLLALVPVSLSLCPVPASTNHWAARKIFEELSSTWKTGLKEPNKWASQWYLSSSCVQTPFLYISFLPLYRSGLVRDPWQWLQPSLLFRFCRGAQPSPCLVLTAHDLENHVKARNVICILALGKE